LVGSSGGDGFMVVVIGLVVVAMGFDGGVGRGYEDVYKDEEIKVFIGIRIAFRWFVKMIFDYDEKVFDGVSGEDDEYVDLIFLFD
ncbi:hypothetical protein Tco_1298284, partial [Tanacetum coccineum]